MLKFYLEDLYTRLKLPAAPTELKDNEKIDECVEVTPEKVRIRKVILDQTERGRAASRLKRQDANA